MRKFLVSASTILLTCSHADAGSWYVKGSYSKASLSKQGSTRENNGKPAKDSNFFGAGLGYAVNENVNFEIDYLRSDSSRFKRLDSIKELTQTQKVKTSAIMIGASFDLYKNTFATPFINVGVGVANNNIGRFTPASDDASGQTKRFKNSKNLAWKAGLGFRIPIQKELSTELAVTHYNFGRAATYTNKKVSLTANTFTIGIKYSF